jgi:hypothetical protein
MTHPISALPVAVKDEDAAHPVAALWRPMLCEVVRAFVQGEYQLSRAVPHVEPLTPLKAARIQANIAEYGNTLCELPEETWNTSVAQWMGDYWEVLVDLWTKEEGRSDLVLHVFVTENQGAPRFEVHLVYVP